MGKRGTKTDRPIGFVLPALVFGLGVAAMWIGIPKELAVRKISGSGMHAIGKVMAIEHVNKKQVLSLAYEVQGTTYKVDSEQDDASIPAGGQPNTTVTYARDDPSVATTDLARDAKTANEYVLAGLLELFVGGWFTYAAIRQRRVLLMKAMAAKRSKSG